MKKNNILKVVGITLLLVVLCTWIFPISYFNGSSIVNGERIQVGLFTLFDHFSVAISYFWYIPVFILVVGGFYGVLYQTNGYRNLLDRIVEKYKDREWIFLTIIMLIFGVVTSVSGLSFGLFFLFPFIITVILLMGYSKITSLLVTVGSVCVGILGTTYSTVLTSGVNYFLGTTAGDELIAKLVILALGLILLIVNTLLYARKHKKNEPRKGFLYPVSNNQNTKTWPIIVVFDVVLLIMILSFMSWTEVFEVTIFADALKAINEFKIGDFNIFAKLLGGVKAFGQWALSDLIGLVVMATGFVALLCRVKFDDMVKGFGAGAKKALRPAFVVALVYLILIITYVGDGSSPISLTIAEPLINLTKDFNVVTASGVAIISHFFAVELDFSTNILFYISSVFTDEGLSGIMAIIWQATYGLAMLFVPTSAILVAGLSYLNVSYFRWLKAIWKLLLELLVVLLAVFLIMTLI